MKKKILILLLFILTSFLHGQQTGVCCVPVADLTVQSMAALYPTVLPSKWHTLLGFCPKHKEHSVPRISQLLLNDQVIILDETDTEYKIQALNQSYGTDLFTHNSIFWTAKQNIFISPHIEKPTLYPIRPLFIPELATTVSAGTALTYLQTVDGIYLCSSLHPTTKKIVSFMLDKKNCCIPYRDRKKQKQSFVRLIRYWAQQQPKKIPYVLGGSSIIDLIIPEDFTLQNLDPSHKNKKVYVHTKLIPPYSGLDCAHLIFLAARISGIPLKSTNTLGLAKILIPFKKTDMLEAGDIALWKGHVVVITDPQEGLLAEARGYASGYGVVHEIAFEEQFKDIHTGTDLLAAYFNQTPLTRLDKGGKEAEQLVTDMRLYKLP